MKMHLLLAALATVLAVPALASSVEPLPPDIQRGIELSPILVDAVYEGLAPQHGVLFKKAHNTELHYALQRPIIDNSAWSKLKHPEECKTFWAHARESHARIVSHFVLPDFHTNLEVDSAVIAGGVALGTTAQVLYQLSRHLEEPEKELGSLCTALDKALPKATATAMAYKGLVKSIEYTDLAKLSISAVAYSMPVLLDAQREARYLP